MSEIEQYLDELFYRLAGTGAAGRRVLAEAEDHLRAATADAIARGLPPDQAEHQAVTRFGPPALVAGKLRAAHAAGWLNQGVSAGWLLAGLAACGLGVGELAAAGRLGWQSLAGACTNFLRPGCYSTGGHVVHATMAAAIVAAAGAALLAGRWLAVRYAGLAPIHRGFTVAAGLVFGLAAFGLGMAGWAPAVPVTWLGQALGQAAFLIHVPSPSFFVGAAALMVSLAAAVSLAEPHPRRYLQIDSYGASGLKPEPAD